MPAREDDPHGLGLGRDPGDPIVFVTPYRHIGRLNDQEVAKLRRHPFEVAASLVGRYAAEGPAALLAEPGEVERLKWVGLYPQNQGGDAFMMRIKVPGGVLSAEQARAVGWAAESFAEGPEDHPLFANRVVDLTTRQSIQLHWLHLADVPRVWERFARVGLTTVMACGDCARNVTSCPVSGADPHEVVASLPVARAISEFFTGNRRYANLPRKFKMAVCGCTENCARVEINDVGLSPARLGDDLGFAVRVGGGLSDGERLASDLDLFVRPEEAVELTRAVAHLFAELGNREHRGLARMRYLVEELGVEDFRHELVTRLDVPDRSGATSLATSFRPDHVGVHPHREPGLVNVGCAVPAGRMLGRELVEAARLAERFGDGTVRLGVDQGFILTGVAESEVATLLAEPLVQRYSPDAGPFTRGVVACTGNEFCRYAITETKGRAVELARRLDERLSERSRAALAGQSLRVHLSGCSASCAQPQIADVGLRGAVSKEGSSLEEAYDVGLGGSLGPEAGLGRWVAGAVPVRDLEGSILRTVEAYLDGRRNGESFAAYVRRRPIVELRTVVTGRET